MSAVKVYYMRCDGCGYSDDELTDDSAASARRGARIDGWTRPRANSRSQMRIDHCPACSEEDR